MKNLNILFLLIILIISCNKREIDYYPNGQIKTIKEYQNGNKEYTLKIYDEDGIIRLEQFFSDNNLVLKKVYNQKGELEWEAQYNNGKLNGLYKEYIKGNILKLKVTFKDNVQHGEYVVYYDNGNVKTTSNFDNGIEKGEIKNYSPSGQLNSFLLKDDNSAVFYKIQFNEKGEVINQYRKMRIEVDALSKEISINILGAKDDDELKQALIIIYSKNGGFKTIKEYHDIKNMNVKFSIDKLTRGSYFIHCSLFNAKIDTAVFNSGPLEFNVE